MKSMCLIIAYFGSYPNYFNLWLESVRYNSTVDFLLVTDIQTEYCYPKNVKVKQMSFSQIKQKIQSVYDFKISLDKPYRLCEYKAAYGDIFHNEIQKYDFWGYCDIDLIFGDIRSFITDEILNNYDKINFHGHFSLHRNSDEMRNIYKVNVSNVINYKTVFKINWAWHFDEYPGVSYICKEKNIKYIDIEDYADLDWSKHRFLKVYDHSEKISDNEDIQQIFYWKEGRLLNIIKNGAETISHDMMYVHLQKRRMKDNIVDANQGYYIVPNEFLQINNEGAISIIEKYSVDGDCKAWDNFKRECFTNRFKLNYWRYKINMAGKRR